MDSSKIMNTTFLQSSITAYVDNLYNYTLRLSRTQSLSQLDRLYLSQSSLSALHQLLLATTASSLQEASIPARVYRQALETMQGVYMNRSSEVIITLMNDGEEEARRMLEVIAKCIVGVEKVHRDIEQRERARLPMEEEDQGIKEEKREVGEAMRIARLMISQFEVFMSRRLTESQSFVVNNTAFNFSIQKYSRI
jgi:hypothetical protein